ncbi:uncharacterized protein LOC131253275 isoform X2 [Magnolia sinica]|uniref:uncharacterized protein LOC131253275 isoform X2 n=1 Tax=Magnolia sinica TaxID=86752 RepID=UPI00265A8FFB|nr:uncharacterized protein LOC131253275 isoform X2 [Magnolia sinica]
MPPEPLPWESRKDFFKEKKQQEQQLHERLSSDAAVGSAARWRESPYRGSHDFVRGGSADGKPSGPSKQGSYQTLFPEESGHGRTPTRSSDRMVDEESCRPSASHPEGRYGRNNRGENKGSSSCQKDWKGHHRHRHSWEAGDASAMNSFGSRQHSVVSSQRSVDDLLAYASHPHSDTENLAWDPLHSKDHHDKMSSVDPLGTGHIYDKDLAWKPLKWTRSSSLSSRGSGFSHSTSSKSIKADSEDGRLELPPGKATPVRSPSGDGGMGVMSAVPLEETCSRKKQRLGWGQGLAKYEKEKVEGPEEVTRKIGSLLGSNITQAVNICGVSSLPDRSPRVTGLSECMSPATPCSVACSSSPGLEEKPYIKVANNDIDVSHSSDSPDHDFRNFPEEFSINLENTELNPLKKISSLLVQLLQPEDVTFGDSNFMQSTALNKLRLLKTDFSEALVKTQSEIDLFENELKSLDKVSEVNVSCPVPSKSIQADIAVKFCKEQADSASNFVVEPLLCNDPLDVCADIKDENIDSPGTVTSKCAEVLSLVTEISAPDMVKADEHSADVEAPTSTALGEQDFMQFHRRSSAALNGDKDGTCLCESSKGPDFCSGESLYREVDSTFSAFILASNKDSARKASEVFDKVLPTSQPEFDICQAVNSVSCRQNNMQIKEKLAMHKHFQRFKERVLTLKFRAFHHLWKEDMRLLSLRKYRAKPQKRVEPSGRSSHSGYQKHRSSIRSRFTSPGNLTLVPTTEIVDFASKLLSDSQIKLYRESLKMPALILDEERRHTRFITSNGLIEDPCAVEKERSMINPWTPEEKEIFMDKLATFGKDFTKIASFLCHKTTADCIEFYYKNHKSESFEKIKERLELRKQGRCFPSNAYLVTSGKKWNREVNAASLDMLGAVAAHADDSSRKTQQSCAGRSILGGLYDHKMSGRDSILEGATSGDIPGTESEAAAADVLASICGGLSSEAMSSCITSSVDPGEGFQEWKGQKINYMIVDRPFTPEVSHNIDEEETCSDESCGELDSVDWTDEEKATFIVALRSYGKDFASISCCVRTKTRDQCKIFFSKARKCLGLDLIHPGPDNEETPMSAASGGRSDSEDACLVEMDSTICCSTQSCSKMDVDLPPSVVMAKCSEGCGAGNDLLLQSEDISSGKDDVGISNPDELDTGRIEEPDHGGNGSQQAPKLESSFNGKDKLLKGDESQSGIVQELSQRDEAATASAVLDCDLPVQPPHNSADDSLVDSESKEHETSQVRSSSLAESASVEGPRGLAQSRSYDVVEFKQGVEPGTSAEGLKTKAGALDQGIELGTSAEGRKTKAEAQLTVPETTTGLDDSKVAKTGSLEATNCRSGLGCPMPDSTTVSNHPEMEMTACPGFSTVPNHQHHVSLKLPPSREKKPHIISWPQNGHCSSELANVALQDSSTAIIDHEDPLHQPTTQSILNFEEHGINQQQKSDCVDFRQQYPPLQILKGYPLQMSNKNEMNGELASIGEKPVLQNYQKMSRNSHSSRFIFVPDSYTEKCNGSKSPIHSASSELAFLPRTEKSESNLGSCSRSLDKQATMSCCEAEKQSPGIGDFKLFGKILSHPPSSNKVNCPKENENEDESPCKSNKSFISSNSEHGTDGTSIKSKKLQSSSSSCMGVEEFPIKSYGFWDGSRIQTGFSSLPDSAKYLAAISEYPMPVCRIDQRPLPAAVVRRTEPSLGSLSVSNMNGGGLTDFQQAYRSADGVSVQPFSVVDAKRRQDMSELQKRNGFETMLGFQQQQSMGVVGMNVVGGRGILVGGCTGVSDPVAAIKMHFANAEATRFGGGGSGGGSVGVIREDESWGRDVGR